MNENQVPIKKISNTKTQELIANSAEIVGGGIGAAMGFFAAGPVGAALFGSGGVLITKYLEKLGNDFAQRFLSQREKVRVGAVLAFASAKFQKYRKEGKQLRDDNFFEEKIDNRSAAEEIFEATILASQRDHQEQKLKYYGNLLANIAYHAEFDKPQANFLVKQANELSWQQLCILALAVRKSAFILRLANYRGQTSFSQPLIFLLSEIYDLYLRGFLNFGGGALLGAIDVNPGKITVQGVGAHLYNMMELVELPNSDLEKIAEILK